MSDVRTKIPVDFTKGNYAKPWQLNQEELVHTILSILSMNFHYIYYYTCCYYANHIHFFFSF